MSCPQTPCPDNSSITNCDPCTTYQDCGCLNPTTWSCLALPGVHSTLGITNDMTGSQVLTAIAAVIDNLVIGTPPSGNDIYAKISASDTTADYLNNKLLVTSPITKTVVNASANEKLRFSFNYTSAISMDSGNLLEQGTDGKFRVLASDAVVDLHLSAGTGITITGTGPSTDPYIISTNPSISVVRSCFDSVWRNFTLVGSGNANVTYVGGIPQYRYRYDGSVEFRGSITYTVAYGAYTTPSREFIVPMGNIPTSCLTAGEQNGTVDLKGINYIDPSGVGDQITQQYGYVIRKNSQNYFLKFQSAFIAPTSKTVVVNFEGAIFHPNI